MFLKFFPREINILDLFKKQVGFAVDAAQFFKKTVSEGTVSTETLNKMREIEHQGDEVAHEIFDQLNLTFITPFDREDIHTLCEELDNIVDMVDTILSRLVIYKLTKVDEELVEFANVIEESVTAVASAVNGLRNMKNAKNILDICREVNRLENVGDSMRDKALGDLFEKEKDPIVVIKWKEIYQDAETILDICEDVAHVVKNIMLKQS